MQNTAVNAPITFEEIVMVMINDEIHEFQALELPIEMNVSVLFAVS